MLLIEHGSVALEKLYSLLARTKAKASFLQGVDPDRVSKSGGHFHALVELEDFVEVRPGHIGGSL